MQMTRKHKKKGNESEYGLVQSNHKTTKATTNFINFYKVVPAPDTLQFLITSTSKLLAHHRIKKSM